MEIKGVAVKTLPKYIELKYPYIFDNWLSRLDEEVRDSFVAGIYSSRWYDVDRFVRRPILIAAEMIYLDPKNLAWDMGEFSAQYALNGIYRFFLRFGGPENMIKRVPFFLQNYYKPANVKIDYIDADNKKAELFFYNFVKSDDVIIYRIAGWGYYTLLTSGAKTAKIKIKALEALNSKMFIEWS